MLSERNVGAERLVATLLVFVVCLVGARCGSDPVVSPDVVVDLGVESSVP